MKRAYARYRRRVLFALVTVVLVFVAAELVVRWGGWALLKQEEFFTDVYDPRYTMVPRAPNPYSELGEVLNDEGFRGRAPTAAKQPGVPRILSVGDSATFGVGVEAHETYSYQIEVLLRKHHAVEVLNGGIPGTALWQHRLLIEKKVDEWAADIVVVYTGPSYRADYFVLREAQRGRDVLAPLRKGLAHLHLYRLLRRWIRPPRFDDLANQYTGSDQIFLPEERVARDTREDIQAMTAACRKAGARLLVVPRQARDTYLIAHEEGMRFGDLNWRHKVHVDNGTVALFDALERFDVPRLDLSGPLLKASYEQNCFLDESHLTSGGHRIVAETLAAELCRRGWIPKCAGSAETAP
ncbi:MAG: SGNH/GDSL hydrolase family protein [Candidatus Lernaella stagnicola]|nr:SGNH/GDSL hydrolase family protein [Candidatus Lernaella stagnicola]